MCCCEISCQIKETGAIYSERLARNMDRLSVGGRVDHILSYMMLYIWKCVINIKECFSWDTALLPSPLCENNIFVCYDSDGMLDNVYFLLYSHIHFFF